MIKNKEVDSDVHKTVNKAFSKAYSSLARRRSRRPPPGDLREVGSDSMETETVPEAPIDQSLDG